MNNKRIDSLTAFGGALVYAALLTGTLVQFAAFAARL
jgi:hypothetical protein